MRAGGRFWYLIPDAELTEVFQGFTICGHKDFILMRCINTIMGADAKKADADPIIQDALV
jgi:ribosomal protein S7